MEPSFASLPAIARGSLAVLADCSKAGGGGRKVAQRKESMDDMRSSTADYAGGAGLCVRDQNTSCFISGRTVQEVLLKTGRLASSAHYCPDELFVVMT